MTGIFKLCPLEEYRSIDLLSSTWYMLKRNGLRIVLCTALEAFMMSYQLLIRKLTRRLAPLHRLLVLGTRP